MERLTDAIELLDGPLDDPAALEANLRDLRRINRFLGGTSLSASAMDAIAPTGGALTMIDVGTGGADIPAALLRRAARRSQRLSIVAIDSRPEVLEAAVRAAPSLSSTAGLELRLGDGRSLAFPDAAFDVAHASLVMHHMEPDAAVALLREMARVARIGVVVNDLDRTWLGWVGAWLLGHVVTRNRYTRHDAPLSVRRAYRADELLAMMRTAGLAPVRTVRGALGQRYAIAARPVSSDPRT